MKKALAKNESQTDTKVPIKIDPKNITFKNDERKKVRRNDQIIKTEEKRRESSDMGHIKTE